MLCRMDGDCENAGVMVRSNAPHRPPLHQGTKRTCYANEDGRFVAMVAYADAVAERYPTIRAGVIHATGLANGPSSSELLDDYRAEQQAASQRLKAMAIADLPSIAAWRRALHRPGIDRQHLPRPWRGHLRGQQQRRERSALVLAPKRPERQQRDHGRRARRHRGSSRHRWPRRRGGAHRSHLATSLTSAPQPDQVVRVVTDQPLHWSERRPREPKSVSNQAHQHRSRRPSSLTHRTEVTSLGWPLRSGNPERPVPHGGHPSRQESPAPTGYPPTAGFRPDRPAGGRP